MNTGIETMNLIIQSKAEERKRIARAATKYQKPVPEFGTARDARVYYQALRDFAEALETGCV
jgi:hypothetical protein